MNTFDNINKTKTIVLDDTMETAINNANFIYNLDKVYAPASNTCASDFPDEFDDFLKMISETRINNEEYNRLVEGYSKKYKRLTTYL